MCFFCWIINWWINAFKVGIKLQYPSQHHPQYTPPHKKKKKKKEEKKNSNSAFQTCEVNYQQCCEKL